MSVLNPTTFLDLVQRTHSECSIQGSAPSTLSNSLGINLSLWYWVNESWKWLQGLRPDWHFMHRSNLSFVTVGGQVEYTATQAGVTEGAVTAWIPSRFRVYQTSAGQSSEVRMAYHDYREWIDAYNISSLRTAQRYPYNFTVAPNQSLMIECPLVGYTITGEYYRAVTGFDEETDEPTGLDAEDRMILVYKAMEFYANEQNAPEVLATAQKETKRILNRLDIRRIDRLVT